MILTQDLYQKVSISMAVQCAQHAFEKEVTHLECSHSLVCKSANVFGATDSLVGPYFEVSAFLKLLSVFVPAKGRTGIPRRRLALQVQPVPFHQGLASHQPELRSRGWRDSEGEGSGERKSKLALLKLTTDIQLICSFNCVCVCVLSGRLDEKLFRCGFS